MLIDKVRNSGVVAILLGTVFTSLGSAHAQTQDDGYVYLECSVDTGGYVRENRYRIGNGTWQDYDSRNGSWNDLCKSAKCSLGDLAYEYTVKVSMPGNQVYFDTTRIDRVTGEASVSMRFPNTYGVNDNTPSTYTERYAGQCIKTAPPAPLAERQF